MDKKQTKLEKSINKRAEEKYDKAFEELQNFFNTNPIARKAKIKVDEDNYISIKSIFQYQSDFKNRGNGDEVKQEVIEDFEAKEVSDLHAKLDSLNYLFNG